MTIDVLSVGALKEDYLRQAVAEYQKRLSAYCTLRNLTFQRDGEIPALLDKRAYKFALCIEGKQFSSEQLAGRIDSLGVRGYSHLQFLIGASDGIPEQYKALCDERLSFSRMTFPHQLMRVLLLEQLYRACNINAGGKYHK